MDLRGQSRRMSVHTHEDLERLSRLTRREFGHAHMSDTKWRKLFDAVAQSGWEPSLVQIKFVGTAGPPERMMRWPTANSFWGPRQWVDTVEFGPIELRSIEWLLIPALVTVGQAAGRTGVAQDLDAVMAAVSKVGRFPLERTAEGLKITGYS